MTVSARTRSGLAYDANGTGPPVLLLHAGIHDRRMWEPHWDALASRFHAIRFDARGFGNSADPKRPYTLHGDALDVLDALEVEKATLVGVSMGGRTAVDFAISVPHRTNALVTVNSTPSGWMHSPEIIAAWEAVEEAYESTGIEAANELEMKMWIDGPFRPSGDVDRELRRSVASVNSVLLQRQENFTVEPGELEPPALDRLGEISCPSLVITSELDQPSVLAGAFELARATGGDHVEIAGCAHLPNLERPREFAATLIPWLEETLL